MINKVFKDLFSIQFMAFKEKLKKFHAFLKEDSWSSFFVTMVLALIIIKFIFFPLLSFLTGSSLPLVIVESCSMYHSNSLEEIMKDQLYVMNNLSYKDTTDWSLRRGFNKGDIIFVVGPKNIDVGDVLIFNANQRSPIIHRVISEDIYGSVTTKGDNNLGLLPYESGIKPTQFIGKAVFRIPFLGWIKLIFFDFQKPVSERGLCK